MPENHQQNPGRGNYYLVQCFLITSKWKVKSIRKHLNSYTTSGSHLQPSILMKQYKFMYLYVNFMYHPVFLGGAGVPTHKRFYIFRRYFSSEFLLQTFLDLILIPYGASTCLAQQLKKSINYFLLRNFWGITASDSFWLHSSSPYKTCTSGPDNDQHWFMLSYI